MRQARCATHVCRKVAAPRILDLQGTTVQLATRVAQRLQRCDALAARDGTRGCVYGGRGFRFKRIPKVCRVQQDLVGLITRNKARGFRQQQ